MTSVHATATAVEFRAKPRPEPHLLGVLMRLITEYPDAPREEIEALYFATVQVVPKLVDQAIQRTFNNDWDTLQKRARVKRPVAVEEVAKRVEKRAAAKIAFEASVKAAVERVKQSVLLDMRLPNGKKLRDCTGADVRALEKQMPSWFGAIADRVRPKEIVGKVLTEREVRAVAPKGWS